MSHEEEICHQNVILEDIRHQMKLAFEGHQLLNGKLDRLDQRITDLQRDLKSDIVIVSQRLGSVERKAQDTNDLITKIIELMDGQDKWLKDHEVRIKTLEVR